MAYAFTRRPIAGADENTWAPLEQAQNIAALSIYTGYLYNDSGTLKMKAGNIGINDGTNYGVASSTTDDTISLAGVTSGNWSYVYMSVSGASVTFSLVAIAGETDSDAFPSATVDALWSGSRGGFYSTSNRIVGVIYVNGSGNLSIIYNTQKQFKNNEFLRLPRFAEFNSVTIDSGFLLGSNKTTLDLTIRNEIDGMSLASSQITCPPGRYKIYGYCQIHATSAGTVRGTVIYDATNAVNLIYGGATYMNSTDAISPFMGIVTIATESLIELRVNCVSSDGSGNTIPPTMRGDWRKIIFEKVG